MVIHQTANWFLTVEMPANGICNEPFKTSLRFTWSLTPSVYIHKRPPNEFSCLTWLPHVACLLLLQLLLLLLLLNLYHTLISLAKCDLASSFFIAQTRPKRQQVSLAQCGVWLMSCLAMLRVVYATLRIRTVLQAMQNQ